MRALLSALLVGYLFLPATLLSASDPIKNQAEQSLTAAQELLASDQYTKAAEELQFALAKINELLAASLLEFLPSPPPGFVLASSHARGFGQGAALLGSAQVEALYEGASHSTIQLTIVVGGMAGQLGSLANFGALFGATGEQAGLTSIRIQGYTGTLQHDTRSGRMTLALQVGAKSSLQLEGKNLAETTQLTTIVEKMDLARLERSF